MSLRFIVIAIAFLISYFSTCTVIATEIVLPAQVPAPTPIAEHRNMIYVSIGRFDNMRDNLDQHIDIITDYNIAFFNPINDSSGSLNPINEKQHADLEVIFKQVRDKNPNARIYLAFGGWRGKEFDVIYEKIAEKPESRQLFIKEVLGLVNQYGADGVDMDWEYPRLEYSKEYALFIRELANALHAQNKRLSAAVIGTETKKTDKGNGAAYLDSVLQDFDNINLMAYDIDFEDHSNYQMAVDSINYWVKKRGVDPKKAILGLPAYSRPGWVGYNQIVATEANGGVATGKPENACSDTFIFKNEVNYYNGLPTIIAKTKLAMDNQLGGVMLWEFPIDTPTKNLSIIQAIHDTQHNTGYQNYCDLNKLVLNN